MIAYAIGGSSTDPAEPAQLHAFFLSLWPRRSATVLRLVLGSLLVLVPLFAQAFGSATGTYVSDRRPREILFLTLTQSGNSLSGSLTIVLPDGHGSTKAGVQEVTGAVSGDHLELKSQALHFDGNRAGSVLLLSVSSTTGDRITFQFTPTSEGIFNKLLAEWRQGLSVAHAQAVRETAAQTLEQDNIKKLSSELASDINHIKNTGILADLTDIEHSINDQRTAIEQIKKDLGALKRDAEVLPMTCYQAHQVVGYDYSQTLAYDLRQTLGYAISVYQKAKVRLEKRLANVPSVVDKITKDVAVLRQALRDKQYPLSVQIVNPSEVPAVVAQYQTLASDAQSRLPKLQTEVDNIVEQAKGFMADAKSIVQKVQSGIVCQ